MWTLIWVGLIVFALCWWAFVIWRFYRKAIAAYREIEAATQRWALISQTEATSLEPIEPQILDNEALAEQLAGLRDRKTEKRNRRRTRRQAAQSRWMNYPAGRHNNQL